MNDSKKKSSDTEIDNQHQDKYNDDVVYDGDETENDTVKKLRKQLKECQKEKREYLEGWQRSKAEFLNARKLDKQEQLIATDRAKESFVIQLFPILDSFDLAFADKEAWERVDINWRVGMEQVHSQFVKILDDLGIIELNPLGEQFDPRHHESLAIIPTNDPEKDGTIVAVKQKGYKLQDNVLRPPKVHTAHFDE